MRKSIIHVIVGLAMLVSARGQSWLVHGGGSWTTGSNWSGGVAPNSGAANVTLGSIIAAASSTISVAGSNTLATLTVSNTGGSYTVGSSVNNGTLVFQPSSGAASITSSAAKTTINSALQLYGGLDVTQAGSGTLTIAGDIGQAYYSNFNKWGTGTVILSGNNSYTGVFGVNAGTLVALTNNALGVGSSWDTVSSGATLALGPGLNLTTGNIAGLHLSGSGAGGAGALEALTGGSSTLAAQVQLDADSTVNTAGSLVFNGAVGGSGALTQIGNGNLTFNNGYGSTGDFTQNGNGTDLINGPVTGGASVIQNGNGTLTLSGAFSGGSIIQNGTGNLNLNGSSSITGGGIFANAGNINIGLGGGATVGTTVSVGGAGHTASITLLGNNEIANYETASIGALGTLNLNGFSNTLTSVTMTGGNITTGAGTLTLSGVTPITVNASSSAAVITGNLTLSGFNPTLNVANGSSAMDLTINGKLTASSGFNTMGGGNIALTGNQANSTGGTVSVGPGTLTLGKTGGVAAISAGTAISINSGGTLLLAGSGEIGSGDAVALNGGTLTANGSTTNTGLGAMTLSSNSTIDFASSAATLGFANSSSSSWAGTLTILGWTWTNSDILNFGSSASGLTAAQLSEISFNIGGVLYGASIATNGNVSAVMTPEAPVVVAMLGLIAAVVIKELVTRRKRQEPLNAGAL